MPGWHEATRDLQQQGKVKMVGIIQEQNPDRCRLFMQWKRMDWPILVDTFNLLEVSVVPLTYLIDEHGIVRAAGLKPSAAETLGETFLDRSWPKPAQPAARVPNDLEELAQNALQGGRHLERALVELGQQVERSPGDGWAHFRLAAGYRLRHDSDQRSSSDLLEGAHQNGALRQGDFQKAVDHWQEALEIDPNNYIWRRRIQQYGARLDKPYPFYDWIPEARRAIRERGEEPTPLSTEPTGSEIAQPSSTFRASGAAPSRPGDPKGRVHLDGDGEPGLLIRTTATAVPRRVAPGTTTRVHLLFEPNEDVLGHWNNESEPLTVWLEAPRGFKLSSSQLSATNPSSAVSIETRTLEVELMATEDAEPGPSTLSGYALYYVCEDVQGTCLYRRQNLSIDLQIVD